MAFAWGGHTFSVLLPQLELGPFILGSSCPCLGLSSSFARGIYVWAYHHFLREVYMLFGGNYAVCMLGRALKKKVGDLLFWASLVRIWAYHHLLQEVSILGLYFGTSPE